MASSNIIKKTRNRLPVGQRHPKMLTHYVLEVYLTEEKHPDDMYRREIYQSAKQCAYINSDLFKNPNQLYSFMKKKEGTIIAIEERRRIKIYKKKFDIAFRRPSLTANALYDESVMDRKPNNTSARIKMRNKPH